MTTCCNTSVSGPKSGGFSLVELLVVIAVIAIIAAVALPNISNTHAAAQESTIAAQEKNLNSIYHAVKAATADMPEEQEGILSLLATNSQANYVPPSTMEGPDGTVTLAYNSESDLFAYGIPGDENGGGESASLNWEGTPVTPSFHVGNEVRYAGEGGYGMSINDAEGNPRLWAPPTGSSGLYDWEPFQVSANGDDITLVTQSGESYSLTIPAGGGGANGYIQVAKADGGHVNVLLRNMIESGVMVYNLNSAF